MQTFVNLCVITTTIFAFGYLCFALVKPERF